MRSILPKGCAGSCPWNHSLTQPPSHRNDYFRTTVQYAAHVEDDNHTAFPIVAMSAGGVHLDLSFPLR